MKLPDYLLWLDLETTGANADVDCIIELGCTLTFADLAGVVDLDSSGPNNDTAWEFERLVKPTDVGLYSMFNNDVVYKMHTDNGLIADLQSGKPSTPNVVEGELIAELKRLGVGPHKACLAGSGVAHFDSKFLKIAMPRLMHYLAYPIIDIGVLRRMLNMWVPDLAVWDNWVEDVKPHRGLADIKGHLDEARYYKDILWRAFG